MLSKIAEVILILSQMLCLRMFPKEILLAPFSLIWWLETFRLIGPRTLALVSQSKSLWMTSWFFNPTNEDVHTSIACKHPWIEYLGGATLGGCSSRYQRPASSSSPVDAPHHSLLYHSQSRRNRTYLFRNQISWFHSWLPSIMETLHWFPDWQISVNTESIQSNLLLRA